MTVEPATLFVCCQSALALNKEGLCCSYVGVSQLLEPHKLCGFLIQNIHQHTVCFLSGGMGSALVSQLVCKAFCYHTNTHTHVLTTERLLHPQLVGEADVHWPLLLPSV